MAAYLLRLRIRSESDPSRIDWQAWLPKGVEVERIERVERNADAREVAERLLRDPQFRYDVEAASDDARGLRAGRERQLEQARDLAEIGVERGQVWIWIHPLKTFGIGDTFGEAYHDALDEIAHALTTLWRERDPELAGE